jgi:hypothetical protein
MPPQRRFAAWVLTGPLGHLYGGVMDVGEALARHGWARARERGPRRQ